MRTVAALYIDPRGPYPKMRGVDCWDESRNANNYDGFEPVVAHPPCGPWSKTRHLCNAATLATADCAIEAVGFVRRNGGVLEHPANSRLWAEIDLPKVHTFGLDKYGGWTAYVEQVDWGHCCVKPTWLYLVGIPKELVVAEMDRRDGKGVATHCVCTGPRQLKRLPVASKPFKRRSPPAFAAWLVQLARASKVQSPEITTRSTWCPAHQRPFPCKWCAHSAGAGVAK